MIRHKNVSIFALVLIALCAVVFAGCPSTLQDDIETMRKKAGGDGAVNNDEGNNNGGLPVLNQDPAAGDFDISGAVHTYNGSVKTVVITPKAGKSVGSITVFYNGSIMLPMAVGTYTVTFNVEAADGWNEATGLVGGILTINRATGAFGSPAAINIYYTPTLTLANLFLPTGYAWNNPATGLNAGTGQLFPATYTDPSGNYETVGGNITVNVEEASGDFPEINAIDTTYTTTLTLANLSLPTGYAWNNPATSLNAGTGQLFPATYTDQSGNYEPAGGNITVNVAKAEGAVVAAPTLDSKESNSITINAVTASENGQTVEYAINTTDGVFGSNWQTGLIFSGLSANTTYYIFARAAENDNYNAGTAVSTAIKTLTQESFAISFADFENVTAVVSAATIYINGVAGKPSHATITLDDPQQYDSGSINWYFNNNPITAGVSGPCRETLTVSPTNFSGIGLYSVTVEAKIDGKLYSKIVTFGIEK